MGAEQCAVDAGSMGLRPHHHLELPPLPSPPGRRSSSLGCPPCFCSLARRHCRPRGHPTSDSNRCTPFPGSVSSYRKPRGTLSPMHTAYIALGANLPSPAGPPANTLAMAVRRLASLGNVIERSSLYLTQPVGFAEQPQFLNAVVAGGAGREARTRLN